MTTDKKKKPTNKPAKIEVSVDNEFARFDVHLLGLKVGTASAYDFDPMELIQYYGFIPVEGFGVPACDTLAVFVHTGVVEQYVEGKGAEEGIPLHKFNLLDLLATMKLRPAIDEALRGKEG